MPEQFFYHSFPRRGANSLAEIEKGCAIISSMRDLGLALIPEFIEWQQPLSDGNVRTFHKVQQRACFTELSPPELSAHSERFGHFSLEFDESTMRQMGGVPVFYVPRSPTDTGGGHLGTYLYGIASDAQAVIGRIRAVHDLINNPDATQEIKITTRFAQSPESTKSFKIDKDSARLVFDMLGNAVTPWPMLDFGMDYLLNMFYPADDIGRGRPLDYYRQREWRIAGAFSVEGVELMRGVSAAEEDVFRAIDEDFFFRPIKRGVDETRMIDKTLIFSGIGGKSFLQLARRVIVPNTAKDRVAEVIAKTAPDLQVEAIENIQ